MINTDDAATTVEKLQQELSALRQQNEEYRHQATFPQLNPIPIYEFDRNGQVVYLNQAAHQTLSQLGLIDACVLPPRNMVWGWVYPFAMLLSRNMAGRSRSIASPARERASPFGCPDWYNSIMK